MISAFMDFLTAIFEIYFWKEDWTPGYVSAKFENFFYFLIFLFGNSWGNSYIKCVTLDIKFRLYRSFWTGPVLFSCLFPKYFDKIVAWNGEKQFLKTKTFKTLNNISRIPLATTFRNCCPNKKEKRNVKSGYFNFVAKERKKPRSSQWRDRVNVDTRAVKNQQNLSSSSYASIFSCVVPDFV